ncbi:unnamed protein product, partial [Iphiclides podalirius]
MALKRLDVFCTRRRKVFTIVILLVLVYVPLHYNLLLANLSLFEGSETDSISCYYSALGDVLPRADASPSPNSIFFHETSCVGNMTSRQACAIESAARAHPEYQIHVLFSAPVTKAALNGPPFKMLGAIENVRPARVHIAEYAKGTPAEQVVVSGALNGSLWKISHASDLLRFLTLHKWGGVYLDLDVVVARRFDTLASNWAARESDTHVATGALAFSRDEVGRAVATAAAREIQTNFRGDLWGHNGPGVITRVLKRLCSTTNVTLMSAESCRGFEVYGPDLFYPIKWQNGKEYFAAGELKIKDSYVYHVWNHLTKGHKVDIKSPYAELARRFCPSTYELYGDRFGM